jgi:peroxiredoxin
VNVNQTTLIVNSKKLTIYAFAFLLISAGCNSSANEEAKKSSNMQEDKNTKELASILNEKKEAFLEKADSSKITAYEKGIKDVEATGILNDALNLGSKAIDFTLSNANGDSINLYKLLENGPVILTWYRGGWCPYCNLTLRYLQQTIPDFRQYNAQLVALSPEIPDQSLSTKEKNELDFEVLSDIDNEVGLDYGVVYTLPQEIAERYEDGFGLSNYNGNDKAQLPLAATYLIGKDGIVKYAFLNADYRERAEPKEIIEVLKGLK